MTTVIRRWTAIAAVLALTMSACSGEQLDSPAASQPAASQPAASEPAASEPTATCDIVKNEDGTLEPLADGFPNEPITLSHHLPASDPFGIFLRHLQQAAGPLSPVRLTIEDHPEFGTYGTWENVQYLESKPEAADGYMVGLASVPGSTTDLLTTQVIQDLGTGIDAPNWLGLFEGTPYAIVTRTDAPWGDSFEGLVEYAQANPDEVKYIARGAGSGLDLAFNSYQAAIDGGIPVSFSIGGEHSAINAAIGAGEADLTTTLMDVAIQFYNDGAVVPIMVSGGTRVPEWPDVPAAEEIIGQPDPWGYNKGLFTVQGVDECRRAWLRELVTTAMDTDTFVSAREGIPGLNLIAYTREEVNALAESACVAAAEVLEGLELIHESVDPADACSG